MVGISMALTPWLAAGGQFLASKFEQHDVRSLLPVESEVSSFHSHRPTHVLPSVSMTFFFCCNRGHLQKLSIFPSLVCNELSSSQILTRMHNSMLCSIQLV